ncbi:hypothetical protein M8756_04805 [Lutimaribacter sp. EGI FJ00015]|nr:hypothetical protein [Lutimaribacter sp. EGI FJ00015]
MRRRRAAASPKPLTGSRVLQKTGTMRAGRPAGFAPDLTIFHLSFETHREMPAGP